MRVSPTGGIPREGSGPRDCTVRRIHGRRERTKVKENVLGERFSDCGTSQRGLNQGMLILGVLGLYFTLHLHLHLHLHVVVVLHSFATTICSHDHLIHVHVHVPYLA